MKNTAGQAGSGNFVQGEAIDRPSNCHHGYTLQPGEFFLVEGEIGSIYGLPCKKYKKGYIMNCGAKSTSSWNVLAVLKNLGIEIHPYNKEKPLSDTEINDLMKIVKRGGKEETKKPKKSKKP